MSLRWRSELLLELRMRGCQAQLLGPGWTQQSQASASAGGSGSSALSAAQSLAAHQRGLLTRAKPKTAP